MGRPTAIDLTPGSKDLETIERAAGYGLTQRQIAALLGISERTLTSYKGQDGNPVDAAVERGKAIVGNEVAEALVNKARTGDVAAIRWYEMTRQGRKEGHQVDGDLTHTHGVLKVPQTAQPADWVENAEAVQNLKAIDQLTDGNGRP